MDLEEEHKSEDEKAAEAQMRVINIVAAILTLVVVLAAIWLPAEIGRGGSTEHKWQSMGVLVLLCAIVAIAKKRSLSLLYLGLACSFFFVSCCSNFHWGDY